MEMRDRSTSTVGTWSSGALTKVPYCRNSAALFLSDFGFFLEHFENLVLPVFPCALLAGYVGRRMAQAAHGLKDVLTGSVGQGLGEAGVWKEREQQEPRERCPQAHGVFFRPTVW